MSLTVKQNLLLNNLMYLEPEDGPFPDYSIFAGRKVSDWLNSIDISKIADPDPEHPKMTTADEWRKLIIAARRDAELMDFRILTVFTDLSEGGGACKSAIFISPNGKDAAVVFKGTELIAGSAQWKDNFFSGNLSDSPHQLKALKWYKECYGKYNLGQYEITLTGHSKGGNKAKYIAILDDTADHCVSFDGEGFSDKFFRKYGVQIRRRADIIENHMVNYDYISLLMNDVGSATYYYGNNYGSGGFTENHLSNTFMRYDENGDFHMDVDEEGRPAEMLAYDEFANSFLRSLKDDDRTKALAMFNELLNAVLSVRRTMSRDEIIAIFLEMAGDEDNSRNIAYFLAYLIRYEQKYPEVASLLSSVFTKFDLGGLVQYVDLVASIINWKKQILWMSLSFDSISSYVRRINSHAPEWVYQKLSAHLEKRGIPLSYEQIRRLADIIEMADMYLKDIVIFEDGTDRNAYKYRIGYQKKNFTEE